MSTVRITLTGGVEHVHEDIGQWDIEHGALTLYDAASRRIRVIYQQFVYAEWVPDE